ncbi:hypothetical protein T492DRAFT_885112 [Pavlovales sp. CCMP2436]|nr:hypothetical protein T492DRAFT_885112 [Pavlovales sp. CCMP2436]
MWSWSGRNTPVSLAALKGPTTSDRDHELGTLRRMAERLNTTMSTHGLKDDDIKRTIAEQGFRKLADEQLTDYKVQADADMYEGFSALLSGDLQKDTTGKYVDVPFVADRGMLRHIDQNELAGLQVLDNVQAKYVPWDDHHLLHIPGAHEFLTSEYRKRKQFDIYIGTLYAMGPQSMEQAWHYYKYIVKQQRPTDRELNATMGDDDDDEGSDGYQPGAGGLGMSGKAGKASKAKPPEEEEDDDARDASSSGLEAQWSNASAQGNIKKKRMPMLNSDKYEELDGTVIAIGKRRTGKSFAFRHILHSLVEHFPAGLRISQTDELNKYWRQYMPAKYIFSKFDPEILHAVFDRQKSILNDPRLTEEERETKARFFIILDDVISDKRIRYDAAIAELFVAGRHYKLFTMITTQYAKAPTLRSNADYVLILHNKQEGQRESLWRDFADFMTKEAFYTLMDFYTEDNEVLIVDTSDSTAKPWEVLKWFKASDPGAFMLGNEEYWAGVNGGNVIPMQSTELPIHSIKLQPASLGLDVRDALERAATEALYALPLQVARHLIARHLVPHRRLLEEGDSAALLQLVTEPRLAALAQKCRDDTKVLAYLTLFCAAVEPPPLDDLA